MSNIGFQAEDLNMARIRAQMDSLSNISSARCFLFLLTVSGMGKYFYWFCEFPVGCLVELLFGLKCCYLWIQRCVLFTEKFRLVARTVDIASASPHCEFVKNEAEGLSASLTVGQTSNKS